MDVRTVIQKILDDTLRSSIKRDILFSTSIPTPKR